VFTHTLFCPGPTRWRCSCHPRDSGSSRAERGPVPIRRGPHFRRPTPGSTQRNPRSFPPPAHGLQPRTESHWGVTRETIEERRNKNPPPGDLTLFLSGALQPPLVWPDGRRDASRSQTPRGPQLSLGSSQGPGMPPQRGRGGAYL